MFGNNEKKLLGNTTLLYLMKLSSIIFPLITAPYLTRILGVTNYSTYTFVSSFILYFQLLIDFGFLLSATKDVAENKENEEVKMKILTSVIIAKICLGILGFLILVILSIPFLSCNLCVYFYSGLLI